MATKQTVNIDYVPVIKQDGNLVKLDKVIIKKPEFLISDLDIILNNPNQNLLDLQSRMCMHFAESQRKNIRFISPYSYYSTYVTGVSFPKIYTYDEYATMIDDIKENSYKSHKSHLERVKENEGEQAFKEALEEYVKKELIAKKKAYYETCIRYVNAYTYLETITECKSNPNIKMYSVDHDGWSSYSHNINSDVNISVNTNFGYGYSSYFCLSMSYKGIEILPYSFIVNYFYADMREIRRCTRNYSVDSENWNVAFKFVEEAANLAATDQERFCNEFVKNEIDAMLTGLSRIVKSPAEHVNSFVTKKNRENPSPFIGVRNIVGKETLQYRAYPSDMPIAYMAEKITNAYALLENLSQLADVYPFAQTAIDKVKEYALEGLPKIKSTHSINTVKVEGLVEELEVLGEKLKALKEREKVHTDEIDRIYEAQKEKENAKNYWTITLEYENSHKEYGIIKEEIEDLSNLISAKREERDVRNEFIYTLNECIKVVEE